MFFERLHELRSNSGLSQARLAKEVGVTDRQMRRYEADTSEPTLSVLIALADYFDVSLDYLVGRSDERKRM